jgi:hypothetical protein
MRYIILLIALCTASVFHAQWPTFNEAIPISIQSPPFDYLQNGAFGNVFQIDLQGTQQDGFLLFGKGILENPNSNPQYTRAFSCKTNSEGSAMWWRRFESDTLNLSSQWTNFGWNQGMIQDEFGRIHSTYSEWDSEIFEPWNRSKGYIVVLNESAEILFRTRIIRDTTSVFGYSGLLQVSSDTTYILYGSWQDSTMYFSNQMPDAFLSKVSPEGQVLWERHYENTAGVWHVQQAMDGGYWVIAIEVSAYCDFNVVQPNENLVLIKTDSQGYEEGRLQLGGPCSSEAGMVVEISMDRVVLASRFTFDEQDSQWDYHGSVITTEIEQVDGNGELYELEGTRKEYLPCQTIGALSDVHRVNEGYVITGFSGSQDIFSNGSQQVGFILKIDDNRDSLWARFYSHYNSPSLPLGSARHWLWDSKLTSDGGVVCCGEVEQSLDDPTPSLLTPWLFKTDSYGCIEPGCQFVNVEEITIGLEQSMTVFPNPARDRTTIRFELPADFSIPDQSEWVMIDMQGREVTRQLLSRSDIQLRELPLDLTNVQPGMYQIHWVSGTVWLDSVKVVVE